MSYRKPMPIHMPVSSGGEIVGRSFAIRRVWSQIRIVAPSDSFVLVSGETGTGKELVAQAIHNLSSRCDQIMVRVNCAAIPTGLLESELFGHERGAFTGAISQRIGRFEIAHHGTIFLDEIADIPFDLQAKLLRVLQEREFERLGSSRTIRSDARVIAATNRDLADMVRKGQFRSDLFYRLNVFPIHVPPLRGRREDIPLLVAHFVEKAALRNNKTILNIPPEAIRALVDYEWPGNVRELQNVVERAVLLASGPTLNVTLPRGPFQTDIHQPAGIDTLERLEREHILAILEETNWIIGGKRGAAARLGVSRQTLQYRMKKLGIHRPSDERYG
jgi:formate hydrogenlyase transcriptional activator